MHYDLGYFDLEQKTTRDAAADVRPDCGGGGDAYNRMNGVALHGANISQSALGASGVSAPFSSSTGRASHIPPFMVTMEGCSNH